MWYANQKDGWNYDYAIDTQQRGRSPLWHQSLNIYASDRKIIYFF